MLLRFYYRVLSWFGIKRRKLTIVFDLDSVLNQLHSAWIELIWLRTGDVIRYGDCLRWNYPLGQKKYLDLIVNEPDFFATLPVMPGATEFLYELYTLGYDVIICTAAHPNTVADKQAWLLAHFPWISYKNIVYATRKELLAHEDRLLVDDGHHNYDAWVAAGGRAVIFDHPWNRYTDADQRSTAPRVRGYAELKAYVKALEASRGL